MVFIAELYYTYRVHDKQVRIEGLLTVGNLLRLHIPSPNAEGFPLTEQRKGWNLQGKRQKIIIINTLFSEGNS